MLARLLTLVALVFFPLSNSAAQEQASVLIVYYSVSGNTRTMAEAVAQGARQVERAAVTVKSVTEATNADVLIADAVVLGSPVYNANVAPALQEFINGWPFEGARLKDKIGAAFVTAGGVSAGEELVQMSLLHSMLIFGMIVVGGPEWNQAFGASAIMEEGTFGTPMPANGVAEHFLEKGRRLGKRVAELAVRWKSVR